MAIVTEEMIEDISGVASNQEGAPESDCVIVDKILKTGIEEFLEVNMLMSPNIPHLVCHVMIEAYKLGYMRKCKELEIAELERMAK